MKNHNRLNKMAQSTIEYLVILTAIIAIIIVTMNTFAAKRPDSTMGRLTGAAANMITNATAHLP